MAYLCFAGAWAATLYLLGAAVGRRWPAPPLRAVLASTATAALLGVFGEVFLDALYARATGTPLWTYQVAPIRHGYTSAFAPVIWGLYGFHLELSGTTLTRLGVHRRRWRLAVIAVEACVLEAALTLSGRWFFGHLVYRYTPGDLWHVTSVRNAPFYLCFGALYLLVRARVDRSPVGFTLLWAWLLLILVALT